MFESSPRAAAAARAAAARLDRLAREWAPTPEPTSATERDQPLTTPLDTAAWERLLASTVIEVDGEERPHRGRRITVGGWTPSAIRGLVVLLAVVVALVGWWWWSGRPVAVAVAPVVVSSGTAIAGSDPPEPSTQSASGVAEIDAASSPAPAPGGTAAEPPPTVAPSASPADAEVVVHVAGLVSRPGLVRLAPGSRVADAIAAAGGVTKPRAAESVNLARVVADGEQIVVTLTPAANLGTPMTSGSAPSAGPVDINAASVEQLDGLPGVGPVLAQRIAQWRSDNGPFRSVDELGEVSGIGDATLAELRPLVRV